MSFLRKILMLLNREVPTETLINRGMKVGENFNRQQGCFLDPTHCFLITIGDDVTMSIRVTVMAHDASTKKTLGYTKIGQVHIGNHVFIGFPSSCFRQGHSPYGTHRRTCLPRSFEIEIVRHIRPHRKFPWPEHRQQLFLLARRA